MTKSEKIRYVNIVVVLLLMFGLQFVPPVGPLTPTGMHVLGIFLGVVYGWSVVDLIWPSIFAIISMSFVEGYTLASVTAGGFGSGTFWIILFMLMFVMVFERAGGTMYLATWFITRKFAKGKPILFTFMFLFASFLVGMLNGIASCLLFYTVLYKICEQVGYKPHDKYPLFMIFGITFASMFGSISHSLLGSPLILATAFQAASGIQLTLVDFITVCWPFAVFMLVIYSICIKYVFRCNVKPIQEVDIESVVDMSTLVVTPRLKVMFFCTILLILGIAGGALLPATWKVTQILNALGLQGISMILLGILTWWKVEDKYMYNYSGFRRRGGCGNQGHRRGESRSGFGGAGAPDFGAAHCQDGAAALSAGAELVYHRAHERPAGGSSDLGALGHPTGGGAGDPQNLPHLADPGGVRSEGGDPLGRDQPAGYGGNGQGGAVPGAGGEVDN